MEFRVTNFYFCLGPGDLDLGGMDFSVRNILK